MESVSPIRLIRPIQPIRLIRPLPHGLPWSSAPRQQHPRTNSEGPGSFLSCPPPKLLPAPGASACPRSFSVPRPSPYPAGNPGRTLTSCVSARTPVRFQWSAPPWETAPALGDRTLLGRLHLTAVALHIPQCPVPGRTDIGTPQMEASEWPPDPRPSRQNPEAVNLAVGSPYRGALPFWKGGW